MRYLVGFVLLVGLGFGLRAALPEPAASAQAPVKSSVAFEKTIAPFVAKHCVSCHGPEKKKADLVLHVYKDEQSLLKNRKVWQRVTEMVHGGEMPPESRKQPTADELEGFLTAVKTVFETADRNAKPDPGRVTMRRLNRAEYNNTIRDLVGVDFQPAEDFPADDVGYGFDNIGDVLTVSPVHLERYLAAAESIMQRAVLVGELPKPADRPRVAIFLEPRMRRLNERTHYRPLDDKGAYLAATYKLEVDGDYKPRVRVYGQQSGKDPVKFALFVDDKELKTFEVKEASEKEAKTYEALLPLTAGSHKVMVKLLNPHEEKVAPKKDEKPYVIEPKRDKADEVRKRALMVQQIQLVGPMDTRPASHRRIMAHKEGASKDDAAREILTRFASRAYRRPATTDEVDRLVKLVHRAEKNGDKWDESVRLALQAVLASPKFLFRVELDGRPDSPSAHPLDDYQLASRLSYFLWASMPDDELFDLAAKKQLHANLDKQVRRMLQDPKAKALVDNFMSQWLQLRPLKNVAPDRKLFPDFDDELRKAMLTETELFFAAVVKEDRSILDLIDADFTFLNERLARHYGIADTNGNRASQKPAAPKGESIPRDKFVRVKFADKERGGVLTQASVLTVTSNPTRTSPVKRGKWVLEQILGTPPPPPPPDVPELDGKGQLKGTLRERMEQHRKNPSCAGCHARMDPIGFAFENFNAVGKFRDKDGDAKIDPSGTLPGGQSFRGPNELKQILKGKKDLFSRCLAEKMLTFAIGRGVEYYDKRAVDRIVAALDRDDYRFSTLMVEIAKSDPFRLRRGKDEPK